MAKHALQVLEEAYLEKKAQLEAELAQAQAVLVRLCYLCVISVDVDVWVGV